MTIENLPNAERHTFENWGGAWKIRGYTGPFTFVKYFSRKDLVRVTSPGYVMPSDIWPAGSPMVLASYDGKAALYAPVCHPDTIAGWEQCKLVPPVSVNEHTLAEMAEKMPCLR